MSYECESALLHRLLEERDFDVVLKHRITEQHFYDDKHRLIWLEIREHFNKFGEVPTRMLIEESLGKLKLKPTEDKTDALVAKFKLEWLHTEQKNLIHAQIGMMDDDPRGALKRAHQQLSDMMHAAEEVVSDVNLTETGAAESIWADYVARKTQPMSDITFPWETLNRATLGIRPGDLIFIQGPYKSMKSFVLQKIGEHAHAKDKCRILVISQEMAVQQVLARAVCMFCGLNYEKFRECSLSEREEADFRENLEAWEENPNYVFTQNYQLGADAATETETKIREHKPDLVLYDGVYLSADSRVETITALTRALKRLASKYKIPIIGTVQENEQGTTYGSRSFAQDCDLLLKVKREKEQKLNQELVILVPAIRESALEGFVINAVLSNCNFKEKYTLQREEDINNTFDYSQPAPSHLEPPPGFDDVPPLDDDFSNQAFNSGGRD